VILTPLQTLTIILMLTIGTVITRFASFILFKNAKSGDSYINYLGKVLPYAAIGLLVVYCLKGVRVTKFPHGLPELIAIVSIVILHYWKENTLLSIGAGTVIYMVLVQYVFI
jgi:branched-subunit amino acid transport protein AzlD